MIGSSTRGGANQAAVARRATAATVVAYAALGLALGISRLVGLRRSYWLDEIIAAADYVRAGPRAILAGEGLPHELYVLLSWATTSLVGESEVVLRLWSAIPFVLGVVLVTAWLHVRLGALPAVLFLFFATASPLLLDITRQARGYGLAFLAMAVIIVAALEAERSGKASLIPLFCAAGVVGSWTLPQFSVAFFATGAALLILGVLRRPVAVGLGVSAVAIGTWYEPRIGDLLEGSQIEYGVRIGTAGLLTAPVDQVLIPALLWIDGTVLVLEPVWLPVIAVFALLIGSSPLLHRRAPGVLVASGAFATVVAVWIAGIYVVPRYLSFLLVPALILLATGIASVLSRFGTRPAPGRTLMAIGVVVTVSVAGARTAPDVVRLPREAHRDAAEAILANAPVSMPVFAYMTRPDAIEYYLGRPVTRPASADDPRVCDRRGPVVLVVQPWVLPPAGFPCMERAGTTRFRFEQYSRGGEIGVWLIPAR